MKSKVMLAGAVAMALAVAACSGGSDDGGGGGGEAATSLTYLGIDVPAGLDPDGPSASIPATQQGIANLMEPLIYYKGAGENATGVGLLDYGYDLERFEGKLAESVTFDEASLTWTFKLREGVKGCNNTTFNADDVLYTFARAKSVSGAAPIGWFLSNVANIGGFTADVFAEDPAVADAAKQLGDWITAPDEYTVVIKQDAPNKLFLPVLTIFGLYIYDKETMEANATPEDPWSHEYANNVNAPSFSPYCIKSWEKNAEMVLQSNEDYYGGAPALKEIVWRKVPQSANRLASVSTGAAQLTDNLTPKEFSSVEGNDDIRSWQATGNLNLFLGMNFDTPPFDNSKVRQAFAYALNYDKIVQDGYFGKAVKWEGQIPMTYPGYAKVATQYNYDPEKAKALLAESGWTQTESLKLTYVSEQESALGPIVTQMAADLGAIGVNIELDPIPQTQFGDRALVKKDLPLFVNDNEKPIGVDAGYATLLFFVSTAAGGLNNMVNYTSETVDNLWAEAKNEGNVQKRDEILAQVQEQLQQDVAWAPVVQYDNQWLSAPGLSGIVLHPDNSVHFNDLSLTQ
jgi:peptide/nickel transport system substrate-binding protein